jgi:hypothetical protein
VRGSGRGKRLVNRGGSDGDQVIVASIQPLTFDASSCYWEGIKIPSAGATLYCKSTLVRVHDWKVLQAFGQNGFRHSQHKCSQSETCLLIQLESLVSNFNCGGSHHNSRRRSRIILGRTCCPRRSSEGSNARVWSSAMQTSCLGGSNNPQKAVGIALNAASKQCQ